MYENLKELINKINNLGNEFDNMTNNGKICYNEIQKQLHELMPKIAEALDFYEDA